MRFRLFLRYQSMNVDSAIESFLLYINMLYFVLIFFLL